MEWYLCIFVNNHEDDNWRLYYILYIVCGYTSMYEIYFSSMTITYMHVSVYVCVKCLCGGNACVPRRFSNTEWTILWCCHWLVDSETTRQGWYEWRLLKFVLFEWHFFVKFINESQFKTTLLNKKIRRKMTKIVCVFKSNTVYFIFLFSRNIYIHILY